MNMVTFTKAKRNHNLYIFRGFQNQEQVPFVFMVNMTIGVEEFLNNLLLTKNYYIMLELYFLGTLVTCNVNMNPLIRYLQTQISGVTYF